VAEERSRTLIPDFSHLRTSWVGVTDRDWFGFLRALPGVDEVNFWMPRGERAFRALQPGEPFLFKLHAPQNFIVGGGFFSHFTTLPLSLAWEAFEEKNGAPDFATMRRRIEKYRRIPSASNEDYTIGCTLLSSPFFFPEKAWIPVPASWSMNIVQGKTYPLDREDGRRLWEQVQERLVPSHVLVAEGAGDERPMYGDPRLHRPRLGQGTFRILITDNFDRRCAATGEKALPVLEAAHIRPVADGGQHRVDNGLLLRSDLHRLFDRGYLTVDPQHRIHVSGRLRSDFGNGEIYYPLENQTIRLPKSEALRPRSEFLEWHSDVMFKR
jgi:putative restriction endonuclease